MAAVNNPNYAPLKEVDGRFREIVEKHGQIPSDKVLAHIDKVRTRAFEIHPYPCLGLSKFTVFLLPLNNVYKEVVERVKRGQTFLDLGCGLGQDLRNMHLDGCPDSNMYGSDLRQDFIDCGYEMFNDKGRFKAQTKQADLLSSSCSLFPEWDSKLDIIAINNVFHLFSLKDQETVGHVLVKLSKKSPDSIIMGCQVVKAEGEEAGNSMKLAPQESEDRYFHTLESWQEFWDKLGAATGTKWKLEVQRVPFMDDKFTGLLEQWASSYIVWNVRRV